MRLLVQRTQQVVLVVQVVLQMAYLVVTAVTITTALAVVTALDMVMVVMVTYNLTAATQVQTELW